MEGPCGTPSCKSWEVRHQAWAAAGPWPVYLSVCLSACGKRAVMLWRSCCEGRLGVLQGQHKGSSDRAASDCPPVVLCCAVDLRR